MPVRTIISGYSDKISLGTFYNHNRIRISPPPPPPNNFLLQIVDRHFTVITTLVQFLSNFRSELLAYFLHSAVN